jgi:hypothetical protein
MNTVNKVLIGLLVAQVAIGLVVHTRTEATGTIRRPEPLMPGLVAAQVQRVAVFKARNPDVKNTDEAEQPAIDLRRAGAGDSAAWVLASQYDYPVRDGAAQELVDTLLALQTTGPVVTSDVRHNQLEVAADRYRRKIVIETADGTVTTLIVGKPSRARQSFVRIDGQSEVHAVSDISESGLDLKPSAWLDPSLLMLRSTNVAYMSVRNQHGTYEFQRNERDKWSLVRDGAPYPVPPGRKFNAQAADIWVKDMMRLTMTEPADPARQIDTPLATVTLRMKPSQPDGEAGAETPVEYVIEIGAKDGDKYYVRMSGNPYAAMVRSPRFPAIIDMNDDIVMIPEN